MWFSSWLRNPKPTSTDGRARAQASPRRRANFQPRLEALEARWVPSTLTVTNNLDSGRGGAGSLRYEIMMAHSGDTIVFAPSVVGQITLSGSQLIINKSLTIQGPGAGKLTISGGTDRVGSRIFEVDGAATTFSLSGLTLKNGSGDDHQNGAFNGGMPPNDGHGGAILNFGALTVSDCVFSHNNAGHYCSHTDSGGAIYNAGTLTLSNSTFSGNSASYLESDGGAIYNTGSMTVTNCALTGNSASTGNGYGAGGGIFNAYGATATVTGSTLSGNTATSGALGGTDIWNEGSMTLTGCYLDGAAATLASPGISNFGTLKIK